MRSTNSEVEDSATVVRTGFGNSQAPAGSSHRTPARTDARGESLAASSFHSYAIAFFFVFLAFVFELLFKHFFPYPFLLLFFVAVVASAWFGGMGAGFFAVGLSIMAVDYFFVPPLQVLVISAPVVAYLVSFVGCAVVASWVSSSLKESQEALKHARDRLEVRVSERTAELQKSHNDLQEREQQLRLLTEVIPQQIWSATPQGSIDSCNQRLLDYVGRTMEQMRGERFLETIHPQDRESFRSLWQNALSAGKPMEGEWRVRAADGQYRWFFTRSVPLHDQEQKVLRWYGTNTDIEERQQAEQALKQTQAELAHLSRVLSMGELTTSIAHEISQPLTAVVSHGQACLEWLSARPPNLERARSTVDRIVQDGTRAGAVLSRIQALYKKEAPAKVWLDLNEVIQELIGFLRDEAIQRHISLRTELAADLPEVNGDRVQLQQVLLNLMMNGMDAMDGITGGLNELLLRSRKEGMDHVLVCVEDSGAGINPETADKIFDPFYSTKSGGIGMGLSICRSIVESHEGRLWTSPRPSGGTVFQFTIPVRAAGANG